MYDASIYTRRKKFKDKYITRNLKTYVDQWDKSFVNNSLGFTFIS